MQSYQYKSNNQSTDRANIRRSTSAVKQRSESRNHIMQLHQSLGNQAIQRIIQKKLTIGKPDDKYEQEADQVAKQVVNMESGTANQNLQKQEPEEDLQTKPQDVQRQTMGEEEEMQMKPDIQRMDTEEEDMQMRVDIQRMDTEEEGLQTKPLDIQRMGEEEEMRMKESRSDSQTATPDVEAGIRRAEGSGQPLAGNVRAPMERAFGSDFGRVRIHTDAQSNTLNQAVNARAFTTGQNIFFKQGEYNPSSSAGKELLAHELTHVVQQNGRK